MKMGENPFFYEWKICGIYHIVWCGYPYNRKCGYVKIM